MSDTSKTNKEGGAKRPPIQCPECGEVPIWGPCPHGCTPGNKC
jgi:hypothetical protein